jgi:hypothetical protein
MKKLFLLLLLWACPLIAEDVIEEEPQTLFGNFTLRSGGYGAFETQFARVNNSWGILVGGKGGWVINSTFTIGGGGYGLVTMHELKNFQHSDIDQYDKVNLFLGWGGLMFEYTHNSNDLIHFTGDIMLGWGEVMALGAYNNKTEINTDYELSSDSFMMIEPRVTAEVNFYTWFRVGVGAAYRLPVGLELQDGDNNIIVESNDFSGISYCIVFKFGSF